MSTTVENTPDPNIEAAYRWLLSYLPSVEWEARRAAIEQYLEAIFEPEAPSAADYHRLIGPEDQIGWYLYLAETSLYEPRQTEVNQAARILPILCRLGSELNLLRRIGGID